MMRFVHLSTLFLAYGALLVVLPYLLWRIRWLAEIAPLGVLQLLIAAMLGPAVLGAVAPEIWRSVNPSPLSAFDAAGWLAMALFAFVTGGRSDLLSGHKERGRMLAVAVSSIAIPFMCGIALGFAFYTQSPNLMGVNASGVTFTLGIAACVAVTALPMLAIVVNDLGLLGTSLGRTALAAAVFDDFGLWLTLAVIGAAARGSATASGTAITIALALLLGTVMLTVVRALLHRLAAGAEASEAAALTWSFGLLATSGAVADIIGIHFAIGALLAGLALPRPLFLRAVRIFEPLCLYIMLPFFFLSVSLKVQPISDSVSFWTTFFILTGVSVTAKFVAAASPSYLFGASLRDSCALGALVQSKGLMEVVALNILFDAGIISSECLAPFLVMAIVTTVLSKPLTRLFLRGSNPELAYVAPLPVRNAS